MTDKVMSLPNEDWKPVTGHDGYYISNMGRVVGKFGRVLRPGRDKNGYLNFTTSHRCKTKTMSIHRTVALEFTGPSNGLTVDHINGVKTDNRLKNLRYCTAQENKDFYSKKPPGTRNIYKNGKLFEIRFVLNGVKHVLKSQASLEEAVKALKTYKELNGIG